jgi:hypothetical protein
MKDDIEPEERPKQAQKPASSSKREKLEWYSVFKFQLSNQITINISSD